LVAEYPLVVVVTMPSRLQDTPRGCVWFTCMKRDYIVEGMTCAHCVMSVREELSELAGVDQVDVELSSGHLAVTGQGFSDDDVRRAVEKAGYALAGSRPSAA